jgi:hypothetical protein
LSLACEREVRRVKRRLDVTSRPLHGFHILDPYLALVPPLALSLALPCTLLYSATYLITLTSAHNKLHINPHIQQATPIPTTSPTMAGPGKLSWDSVEVWQRLVAAIIASGVKVSISWIFSPPPEQAKLTTTKRSILAASPPTSARPTTRSRTVSAQSRSKPKSSRKPLAMVPRTKSFPPARARPSRRRRGRLLPLLMVSVALPPWNHRCANMLFLCSRLRRPHHQEYSVEENSEEGCAEAGGDGELVQQQHDGWRRLC